MVEFEFWNFEPSESLNKNLYNFSGKLSVNYEYIDLESNKQIF